jgi:glycosyltransferase involved in cell wall biosynthesis
MRGRGHVNDSLLFILPAFNESASVAGVVEDLRSRYPTSDVLVIDDGSTDETSSSALAAGARVLRLPMNLGIGAAVQTGLLFAARYRYGVAVQVDADGQHPASEVQALLDALDTGSCDAVVGSRFLKRTYSGSLARRIGNSILSRGNSWIVGQRVSDATSGFRAYNRRAISFLATTYADDYPEAEAIVALARNGLRVAEVAVSMRARESGRSSITAWRAVFYMMKVLLAIVVNASRHHRQSGAFQEAVRAEPRKPSSAPERV